MKTIVNLLLSLFSIFLLSTAVSGYFEIPLLPTFGGLVAASILMPQMPQGLAFDLILTDLKTAFGNYYLKNQQNMNRLLSLMKQKTFTPSLCTTVITEETKWRASKAVIGSIVQSFQKGFTPKGNITFTPRDFDIFNLKIDMEMYPDDIKGSWLGFLEGMDEQERAKWPFIRYAIEVHVLPQREQDLELLEYYKGVRVNPTAGTAGTTGASMNGIRKLITDGDPNDLALGTITVSNIFDKVEEASDKVPDMYKSTPMHVMMAPKWERAYWRDKRNTHGGDTNFKEGSVRSVDFSPNLNIVGVPSMAGTDDMIIMPKTNLIHLRRPGGYKAPKVEEAKREVFFMTDWWEAFAIALDELVWYHNQDPA